ncbi:bifunctional diguanylate cyclase/phosphodiesterase [Oceanospirillum beijerinckii]|uniref:bifunctional diguanylate cyclase/phosphodiesterase n=1 Tax=Oceanospirillum beijerinckii TaxID=64976 RepID=UPI00040BFBF0|nr:EAL domain-containing protein [Oceanospirillum beijerinckii]
MNTTPDDILIIEDDSDLCVDASEERHPYQVLIVDDDTEVHAITHYALGDCEFLGQPLEFISAYSADQAQEILRNHPDIALVFLDVVMETDDAGLQLIRFIREQQNNWLVRIILRTGQPGQAPEKSIITQYDINDYKSKTELTSTRLYTTTLVALRAYQQLKSMELSRRGLEKILAASSSLFQYRSMAEFAQGVVLQVRSFIEDHSEGVLLCAIQEPEIPSSVLPHPLRLSADNQIQVIAGTDQLTFQPGTPIQDVASAQACALIEQAIHRNQHIFNDHDCALVFKTQTQATSVVYLSGSKPLSVTDKQLLEIFCSKVAICFDNINYYERLQYKKNHDQLTGLLNRSRFIAQTDRLKQQGIIDRLQYRPQELQSPTSLSSTSLSSTPLNSTLLGSIPLGSAPHITPCLLVLGIDRFRDINNDLGYTYGDQFLIMIAQRLRACIPEGAILARLGGDEFAVYLPENRLFHDQIDQLRKTLTQPLQIEQHELIPSISIGYLLVDDLNKPCYELLSQTEDSLLSAKRLGGNRCIQTLPLEDCSGNTCISDDCSKEKCDDKGRTKQPSRLTLIRDMTYALERDELALYYQPIIHCQSGQLAGFEALLRWHHPTRGVVSPGAFLDVIEPTDLMLAMGDWILRKAVQQAELWNQFSCCGNDKLSLSINVSARQIMFSDLEAQMKRLLNEHKVQPGGLRFEITESLIMEDIDQARDILHSIKDLGLQLSLDDFGTGYSSMSYLNHLPFDILKLDRSFIHNMLKDEQTAAIIDCIIQMAHKLDIDVVAEGVETQAQYEKLQQLGCDYLQGYFFGRPMPEDKATEFIVNRCLKPLQ